MGIGVVGRQCGEAGTYGLNPRSTIFKGWLLSWRLRRSRSTTGPTSQEPSQQTEHGVQDPTDPHNPVGEILVRVEERDARDDEPRGQHPEADREGDGQHQDVSSRPVAELHQTTPGSTVTTCALRYLGDMVNVPLGPAPVDISGVRAGDLNEFQITLLVSGSPINLTSTDVTASARSPITNPDSLDAVCTVLDGPAGLLSVRWPGEDVRTWLADKAKVTGVWDLQLSEGETDPLTVAAGSFSAELDVTR